MAITRNQSKSSGAEDNETPAALPPVNRRDYMAQLAAERLSQLASTQTNGGLNINGGISEVESTTEEDFSTDADDLDSMDMQDPNDFAGYPASIGQSGYPGYPGYPDYPSDNDTIQLNQYPVQNQFNNGQQLPSSQGFASYGPPSYPQPSATQQYQQAPQYANNFQPIPVAAAAPVAAGPIKLTKSGAPRLTRHELIALRAQQWPGRHWSPTRVPVMDWKTLDHLDPKWPAIEQPPDGENVMDELESCMTCIRNCYPCRGTQVLDGRCQRCHGAQGKNKRNCYWIEPQNKIWTFTDYQDHHKKVKIPSNTVAGIANRKNNPKPSKPKKTPSRSSKKRNADEMAVDDDIEQDLDIPEGSIDDVSGDDGNYDPRGSDGAGGVKRGNKRQATDRHNVGSQRQDLGNPRCVNCRAEQLDCDSNLPCQWCVDNSAEVCVYDMVNQVIVPGSLMPDNYDAHEFPFMAALREEEESIQDLFQRMAMQIQPGIRYADPNGGILDMFAQEAVLGLTEQAAQGGALGIVARISVPAQALIFIDRLASQNIQCTIPEVQSLATGRTTGYWTNYFEEVSRGELDVDTSELSEFTEFSESDAQ